MEDLNHDVNERLKGLRDSVGPGSLRHLNAVNDPRQTGETKAATYKQVLTGLQELTKRFDGTRKKAEQMRNLLAGASETEIETPLPKPGVNMPLFDTLAYELVLLERQRAILDHQLTTALEAVR